MRWAFWRRAAGSSEAPRALPDDVGLPAGRRPAATPGNHEDEDEDEDAAARPTERHSGAAPVVAAATPPERRPRRPTAGVGPDRATVAAAAQDVAGLVRNVRSGPPALPGADVTAGVDATAVAVAATGALAGRLLVLSGADDIVTDEPADELLHAYADLLASRAGTAGDGADLRAVAHLAAAAAEIGTAADPPLLLLADVPVERQLQAAVVLLAQTVADGGGPPDLLVDEVRDLFREQG